jgi:transposase
MLACQPRSLFSVDSGNHLVSGGVLCVDEKSQIQALDRTQPGLPIKPGRCGTRTQDYKRNGTTTLFAALETLQGKVVGECQERHRHQEFLKFLRLLDTQFPGDVPLHLIMDNYGTHKHAKVKAWLKRHPRFVSHFVPTSSSWMNLVERWTWTARPSAAASS